MTINLRDTDRLVPLPGLVSNFVVKAPLSEDHRVRRLMDDLQDAYHQQLASPEERDRLTREAAARLEMLGYKSGVDFTMLPAARWMTAEEDREKRRDEERGWVWPSR